MANISGATVSRVLSGRTDVPISPEARARVLEAAQLLGYRPNPSARALMTGRTGLVGFWMSFDYSRYRGQVLDCMRTELGQTELALAVTDVDVEYASNHSFDRSLRVPVDGIIAFDNSASVDAFAKHHDKLAPNTPFVSMGAYWSEAKSFVGVDLRAGADVAMDHLLATGRRRIAYMAPWTSELINSGPRYEAYVTKMSEAGLPTSTIGVERVTFAHVKDALTRSFEAKTLPEALLCMNDDIAIAASYVLEGLGLRAGRDVALVGFDGIEEAEHCPCPITTVRQPIQEMCELTFQFLKSQMEDPTAPLQQRILRPNLVIRESTQS
jgi:LacI family transcriptional regulator